MNRKDLQQFIDAHNIDATILPMDRHTSTVEDAARALSVETDQIIKSLVFIARGEPLIVINNGISRVDRRKLGATLGINRKKIKFADAEQVKDITGYMVGSMPPFGHRRQLQTLVDTGIALLDTVFGGGGDINAMMRLYSQELLRVTQAKIIDLSE